MPFKPSSIRFSVESSNPSIRRTFCPPLNNRRAGTPTIFHLAQRLWLFQALTLTTLTFGYFLAALSRTGTRALQGAHGGVKKSTRTGIPASITSFSKFPSLTSTRCSTGLIRADPRLPSAPRENGLLFDGRLKRGKRFLQ